MARVLVVDDERGIRITLSAFLREDGHEVDSAEDVEEAERLLSAKTYDVVVTDIILPRVDGVELLRRIKDAAPDTQVILMTGEPTVDTAAEALRRGAADYLFKPCDKFTVQRAVSNVVRIKTLSDEKRKLEEMNRRYQEDLELLVAKRTATLEKREGQLRAMMDGSISALTTTVEMRDPYTAGHERRVATLACAIAKRMGSPEGDIHGVQIGGFLHDLGKIAVPSEILSKPSKLSEFEFGLIKTHPQTGFEILKKIGFIWPVAEMTLQHHERMDGTGYPKGLKGAEIIPAARILAVADVVEAMSSHRPYRPALGMGVAIREIHDHRGSSYDADVVDACREVVQSEGFSFEQVPGQG